MFLFVESRDDGVVDEVTAGGVARGDLAQRETAAARLHLLAHEIWVHGVELGAGAVDFPLWMETLWKNGYRGFLTIERECGDDPVRDCTEAIRFLRETDGSMRAS